MNLGHARFRSTLTATNAARANAICADVSIWSVKDPYEPLLAFKGEGEESWSRGSFRPDYGESFTVNTL
jgi:hypothetical protein